RTEEVTIGERCRRSRCAAAGFPDDGSGRQVDSAETIVQDEVAQRTEVTLNTRLLLEDHLRRRWHRQIVDIVRVPAVAAQRRLRRVLHKRGRYAGLTILAEPVLHLHLLAGVAQDAFETQPRVRLPQVLAGLEVDGTHTARTAYQQAIADCDRHADRK